MTSKASEISDSLFVTAETITQQANALRMDYITGPDDGTAESDRLNMFAVEQMHAAAVAVRKAAVAARQTPDDPAFIAQWAALVG